MAGEGNGVVKGFIAAIEPTAYNHLYFQINPEELGYGFGVDWHLGETPGQYAPMASFSKMRVNRFNMELVFLANTAEMLGVASVEMAVAKLAALTQPSPNRRAPISGIPRSLAPKMCYLYRGEGIPPMYVVVERFDTIYKLMDANLRPRVAHVTLSLVQVSRGFSDQDTWKGVHTLAGTLDA